MKGGSETLTVGLRFLFLIDVFSYLLSSSLLLSDLPLSSRFLSSLLFSSLLSLSLYISFYLPLPLPLSLSLSLSVSLSLSPSSLSLSLSLSLYLPLPHSLSLSLYLSLSLCQCLWPKIRPKHCKFTNHEIPERNKPKTPTKLNTPGLDFPKPWNFSHCGSEVPRKFQRLSVLKADLLRHLVTKLLHRNQPNKQSRGVGEDHHREPKSCRTISE